MATRKIKIEPGFYGIVVSLLDKNGVLCDATAVTPDEARQLALDLSAYAEQIEKRLLTVKAGQADAFKEVQS